MVGPDTSPSVCQKREDWRENCADIRDLHVPLRMKLNGRIATTGENNYQFPARQF